MDVCTVETGLLKKKPCGETAVTKCGNCEQSLCKKHAVPQVSAGQKKAGGFLCPECAKAWKAQEKAVGPIEGAPASSPGAKKPAEQAKAPPTPAKPPAGAKPPTVKPAAPEKKPEPPVEDSGPLEFTPEPKKPDDKK